MATATDITLWVKAEPFTYGALPVAPHPRLSFHNIKKIVSYAKTKAKLGFPRLSYSVWKHIACNKLQLPEDMAWMYFATYDLVREDVPPAERAELDRCFAKCTKPQELEQLKNVVSVPTLEFVLFLFIQHLHKINLRSSLVSPTEEWPMRSRSPDLESGRTTPTGSKSLDEHSHMTFVLTNINELLELLVEPDSYSGGKGAGDLSLSLDAVIALDFLIKGSIDKGRNVLPLHEIALMQSVHAQSGYSKISQSFSFRSLQSWLRSKITQNPFGISTCISTGRRLSWPLAGEDKEAKAETKRGRIATNAFFVPKENVKGNKIVIMSQVCRQTIGRQTSATLENASVKIHRCHHSFIYLLTTLRSVSIEKCRHTTVVLGSVETSIQVNNCEQLTLIAASRHFAVSGSTLCTFHLLIPTRPLVLTGNDSLKFAPYHTYYGNLEEHLKKSGLCPEINTWNQALSIGVDYQDGPVWEVMQAKEFYTFTIPFHIPGPTKAIPCPLPTMYKRALQARERQIESWQLMVKDAGLGRPQRKQFQTLVETRFQEWLSDTGHKRQLDGLVVSSSKK